MYIVQIIILLLKQRTRPLISPSGGILIENNYTIICIIKLRLVSDQINECEFTIEAERFKHIQVCK